MILHFFPVEKFTLPFYNFIENNYSDHYFVFHGKHNDSIISKFNSSNCIYIESLFQLVWSKKIKQLIGKSKKIIIHSYTTKESLLSFFNKSLYEKGMVVFWGSDIYCYDNIINGTASLLERIKYKFKKNTLKKYQLFSCNDGDYKYACKYYGISGKKIDTSYVPTIDIESLKKIYMHKTSNKEVRILLGNSATETNCHIEALKKLSVYKNENIKIIVPLSYGNNEYRDKVITYGKKIFSDKFVPITEFLTPYDYSYLLSSIDVALFNNNRQQAIGNIQIVGYFGAKIYLRNNTSMWDYFSKDNINIYDISAIGNAPFKTFVSYNTKEKEFNHKSFSKIWDIDYLKQLWDKAF